MDSEITLVSHYPLVLLFFLQVCVRSACSFNPHVLTHVTGCCERRGRAYRGDSN